MPVKGDSGSTTKAAIAPGTVDIRENPTQDISVLSRNTENALNELGRIFDKKKIEEQQELAAVFGEEAFRLAHNMKDDGSGRKIAVHAIIGGIMSQITGAGFASGAVGAGLNEALINAVKGKDPGTAQIVSAIVGAAAAKVAGGSAAAGASAAATGTKWNLLRIPDYNEMKRRTEEAKTDEERKAIEDEYKKKDKEQEEQEAAEAEELARQGIIPEATILDILNKRYSPQYYVSFDGSPAPFRLPSVTVEGRLHSIFDLAGYLPFPVGSIASGADADLFYKEGDHIAAGWAAASIIPFEKYFKALKDLSKFEAFAKMTTRTSKIADRTVTIGGDVWEKGPFKRGDMIDDALGNNLGHNFPIIDKLENGVITSNKSIDLTGPSYQTAKGIYNKLRRDVDALDEFTTGRRKNNIVSPEDYSAKKLEIAVQDMKITAEQQRGLEMVKEYAKEKGIEISITVVK